jgi:hypothetical protein
MIFPKKTPPTKLRDATILKLRPPNLGTIEPELAASPFRNQDWFYATGEPFSYPELNQWHATRGWICQCLETPDYEGPDHHIIVAWQLNNQLHQRYFKIGYDTYHWACGSPAHYQWFFQTMKPGHSTTLLINPQDPNDCQIFGMFEAFVKSGDELLWVAT